MQKKKNGVKKCLEISAIKGGGGGGPQMANAIKNFHFDYLTPSLTHTINSLHDLLSLLSKEGKIRLSCRAYKTQIPVMFKAKPVGQK